MGDGRRYVISSEKVAGMSMEFGARVKVSILNIGDFQFGDFLNWRFFLFNSEFGFHELTANFTNFEIFTSFEVFDLPRNLNFQN